MVSTLATNDQKILHPSIADGYGGWQFVRDVRVTLHRLVAPDDGNTYDRVQCKLINQKKKKKKIR